MQIRTMIHGWYVCEFRGVCFITWVCERDRNQAADFSKYVAEAMAPIVTKMTGLQVEVVPTPSKPNNATSNNNNPGPAGKEKETMSNAQMTTWSRREMQDLRERAKNMAGVVGTNPDWSRAYLSLADAADRLDAMIARTQDQEVQDAKNADERNKNDL